ncbi:MAG: hypothetical protein RR557_07885 [Bacilli bacterium]
MNNMNNIDDKSPIKEDSADFVNRVLNVNAQNKNDGLTDEKKAENIMNMIIKEVDDNDN